MNCSTKENCEEDIIIPLPQAKHQRDHMISIKIATSHFLIRDQLIIIAQMLRQKQDEPIHKSLKRYLRKSGRVSFQLKDLMELLRVGNNYDYLVRALQIKQTVPHMFKILILLERLMLQRIRSDNTVGQLIGGLRWEAKGELQQLLETKLLLPYKLFLQRRAASAINVYYAKSSKECEVRVYQLINLLTIGTSFTDILYTFGRYYLHQYGCAVDFNISIGADLQIIYKNMVDNVKRPASRDILQEIEVLHEKLYVVFYNCYFHKYMKHYVPKWVITDIPSTPRKDSSKSTSKSTSASKPYALSSTAHSGNLGDSCLFLNGSAQGEEVEVQVAEWKEDEGKLQERFKLLQSMERVVSMFKQ